MFNLNKLMFWNKPKCHYCNCPDVRYHRITQTDKGKKKLDYYCGICYKLRYLQGK